MRKSIILLILLLLCRISVQGQNAVPMPARLSDSAFASVLTCGPGDEFYESFGHTALRICDSAQQFDIVFNYGTFDFDEPHFYLRFAGGRLNYLVATQPTGDFWLEYHYYGRSVCEQRLRLGKSELDTLYKMLTINVRPENRYYKYDFFRDNCATRVWDMVATALKERSLPPDGYPDTRQTYRDLVYKYTDSTLLWWRLGVDLLLGSNCDRLMTRSQYAYIPTEMMWQLDTLLLTDGEALAEPAAQMLDETRTPLPHSISPTMCFWILFAIVLTLTLIARRAEWKLYWLDGILYAAVGAVSLLLIYMTFFSDHWCTKGNFNLLWANPLYLWLLARLRHRNCAATLLTGLIMLAFLAGFNMWPQSFNSAVVPIVLTLEARLLDRFTDKKKYKP